VRPPGGLDELGPEGRRAWDAVVARTFGRVLAELESEGRGPQGLATDATVVPDVRTTDWPAFPVRIAARLGAGHALRLLDCRPPGAGDVGRARHQEEYAEWRLIRDGDEVRGIELTTELREYWRVLAAHEPRRTRELVAELAGAEDIAWDGIYGALDPVAAATTPEDRARAFTATMLPTTARDVDARVAMASVSRFNDGRAALCCMIQPSNTLHALVSLVASAARPHLVTDSVTGRTRFPSGSEAIVALGAAAQDGRNSDPVLVERIVRFVTEGRSIGLDDPLGIYVHDLQRHELAQPGGEDVPAEWVELSRGVGADDADDGRSRYQRLKLELPHDADFALSDLVIRRTGERLRFGGQIAELVELAVYVRSGAAA
jgi:hypothetical protein